MHVSRIMSKTAYMPAHGRKLSKLVKWLHRNKHFIDVTSPLDIENLEKWEDNGHTFFRLVRSARPDLKKKEDKMPDTKYEIKSMITWDDGRSEKYVTCKASSSSRWTESGEDRRGVSAGQRATHNRNWQLEKGNGGNEKIGFFGGHCHVATLS